MKMLTHLILFAALLLSSAGTQAQVPLHVSVVGTGMQSAVLIPGFTCPGSVWDATVKQLSPRYTCYIITFPGFAGMPAESDPHFKGWIASVAAYITKEHLGKPVVIGHSIGGVMAMTLAAEYPQLVSKIVVVDALPCLAAMRNPAFKADPNADCSALIARFQGMSDSTLRVQQTAMARAMMSTDTVAQRNIVDWSLASDRKTMGQIYCEFTNIDIRDTIAHIRCPALVMLEPSFKMFDAATQQQFAKMKTKKLVYAGKGLHFIMYDDSDWYMGQLKAFLL